MEIENVGVNMVREDLENLPDYPIPPGFSARWFRPGDEALWQRIVGLAEKLITPFPADVFQKEFAPRADALPQRQCFLCDARGEGIATATAWFDDNHRGKPYGRIHWVAVIPEMQGRGLSKPLMSIVCKRLGDLGHERAYLATSTARIPALNLYLRFGFAPEIASNEDLAAWRKVDGLLKTPLDLPIAFQGGPVQTKRSGLAASPALGIPGDEPTPSNGQGRL